MKFYKLSPKRKIALVLLLIADALAVVAALFVILLERIMLRPISDYLLLALCLLVSQGVIVYVLCEDYK